METIPLLTRVAVLKENTRTVKSMVIGKFPMKTVLSL